MMAMTIHALVLGVILFAGVAQGTRQTPTTGQEEFSAVLTNISNVGGTGITPLKIRINRWTSDEDNERMLYAS